MFAVYAYTAYPTVAPRDSADLAAAALTVSPAHPPGYPLYILLGKAWVDLVPWGEPAYRLNGTELGRLTEDERALVRNDCVGFVFQSFQLIPTLTALENVLVPLELRGGHDGLAEARELLAQLGMPFAGR